MQIEIRHGEGQPRHIAAAAKELVAAQPELLVIETTPGTAAVLKETHTIPVVFTTVSDPVGAGFVQSLSHPGSNATGFINIKSSVGGQWLQLLKKVMPQVTRATVLFERPPRPGGLLSTDDRGGRNAFGNHDQNGVGRRYGRDGKGNLDYRPNTACRSNRRSTSISRQQRHSASLFRIVYLWSPTK